MTLSFTARPYAFSFVPERTAFVLIDFQRDFVNPGGFGEIQCGSPEVFVGVRAVVPATQPALAAARALGLHIVHTREGHRADLADLNAAKRDRQLAAPGTQHTAGIGDAGSMGRLLVRGEYGHDLVDELKPRPGEVVIDKPGKGAFWATDLHRRLMARGVTHLVMCGVTTECCVAMTAREASDRGFQVCILEDCTDGFDAGFVRASLDMFVSFDGLFGFAGNSAGFIACVTSSSSETPPSTPLEPVDPLPSTLTPPAPPAWDGETLDLTTLQTLYRRSAMSPVDVISRVYDRIEAYERENPHAWILLRPRNELLAEARALEQRYTAAGATDTASREALLPPLYGVPFAVKDSFDITGLPTTAACPSFTYIAKETAPTVTAVLGSGGMLIGKTNMDQLATGLTGCRSPYGVASSAYSRAHISGGSSSGSAVVVGARLVTFSLATDTAGSGRVPAAFNGIVGFKPTKGTLSYRGIVPCCRSIDTATILALNVGDARRVWYVVDQHDAADAFAAPPASLPVALADYRGLRAGGFTFTVPPESVLATAAWSPSFRAAFDNALALLPRMGGRLRTMDEEAYAPFSRATDLLYNGTLVNERIACMSPEYVRNNIEGFHAVTRELFRQVLERGAQPWDVFADKLAQTEATKQAAALFDRHGGGVGRGDGVDVLVVPTSPRHPTIAEVEADPIALNSKLGFFTHFGNVLDLCAISVNASFVDGGMPFGVCFVCARGMDGYLFDVATEFERMVQAESKECS